MHQQCHCETPAIIINKNLPWFVMSRVDSIEYLPAPSIMKKLRHMLYAHRTENDHRDIYNLIYSYFSYEFIYVRKSTFVVDETQKKLRVRSPFIDTIERTDTFTLLDTETGELVDIFQLCECGHCDICTNQKRFNWSVRCELECQSHPFLPFFITLTYNNKSLPKDGELCKNDLNLFVHRFRKNLEYKFGYTTPFRLVKCGEYGSNRGRPHYHLLIWFDKHICTFDNKISPEVSDRLELKYLTEIVQLSWSWKFYCDKQPFRLPRGYVFVEQCKNSKAGSYLGKYLCKSNIDHNPAISRHKVKPFLIGSRKGGSIAKPFLLTLQPRFFTLAPGQELKYNNIHKTVNAVESVKLTKWVLQILAPSMARMVRKPLRDTYHQFVYQLHALQFSDNEHKKFADSIHVVPLRGCTHNFSLRRPSSLKDYELHDITRFLMLASYTIDCNSAFFEQCNIVSAFRDKYMAYSDQRVFDVFTEKSRIIKRNQQQLSKYKLIGDYQ